MVKTSRVTYKGLRERQNDKTLPGHFAFYNKAIFSSLQSNIIQDLK